MARPTRTAKKDLDELLNGAIQVAAERLEEGSELAPFALALRTDGEILHFEPDPDDLTGADPNDEAVLASLRSALKGRATELRAVALVADVTLEGAEGEAATAAIAVALEHRSTDPLECIVPYELAEGGIALADLVVEPGERHVFAPERSIH